MPGSHTLKTFPLYLIQVLCPRCDRSGQYHRQTLLDRYGPDQPMPDLLRLITACQRRSNAFDSPIARYSNLVTGTEAI
jgi:hypothetical protein